MSFFRIYVLELFFELLYFNSFFLTSDFISKTHILVKGPVALSCTASTVLSCYSNTVFLGIIIRNFAREVASEIALQTVCYVSTLFKINFSHNWNLSFNCEILRLLYQVRIRSHLALKGSDVFHHA